MKKIEPAAAGTLVVAVTALVLWFVGQPNQLSFLWLTMFFCFMFTSGWIQYDSRKRAKDGDLTYEELLEQRLQSLAAIPSPISGLTASEQSAEDPVFCADCGRKYTTWSRQSGFNPQTGEPNMVSFNACPGWDKQRTDDMMAAYSRASTRLFGGPPRALYTCGEVVVTEPSSSAHVAHAVGDVIGDCPGCLEQMIADGIITRAQAEQRLA